MPNLDLVESIVHRTFSYSGAPMHTPISSRDALGEQLAALTAPAVIGIDTEFLREKTYFAQLCLIQLSTAEDAWCIDTVGLDVDSDRTALAPLQALLADARIVKVMHAARQDLEVLWPHVGTVQNVFDTQIAAALCGAPAQIGYAALVNDLLQVQLQKSETRTDWSRRPLSAAQISYAIDDVRYLLPACDALRERLTRNGRLAWFEEDSAAAARAAAGFDARPDDAWLRLKGLAQLDEHRQRLAQTLAAWRERRAIKSNRPRGWLLPDAALRDIVMRVPRSAAELASISELPEGVRNNSGDAILQIVSEAHVPLPAPPLPPRARPEPAMVARVQRLLDVARQVAGELRIASEVLGTRRDMEQLATGIEDVTPLQGWRRAVVGERLLAAL
jgi:ribonuclease D